MKKRRIDCNSAVSTTFVFPSFFFLFFVTFFGFKVKIFGVYFTLVKFITSDQEFIDNADIDLFQTLYKISS